MPDDGGFFVFIWFVMMIGTIVGWIILLTAICRMARAHEEISETIGMALLGRSPRRSPTDTVSSEPSECMECHGIIPTGQTQCPQCGWSYEKTSKENAARLKEEGGL